MIINFKEFLRENISPGNINQPPGTKLDEYIKYYKMWCDENGVEYNFKNKTEKEIIRIGTKYAQEHNLPNMFYYRDDDK